MNASPPLSLTPRELVRLLIEQRKLWIAPALACAVLSAAYSLVMPRYWEASQALVVRQETAGSQGSTPGKFADLYEMRTMQETILEVAKSRDVVVATIKAVDQKMTGVATEPTAEDIEEFRERLKMLPPDGGEFGKSEVFYFYLKDPSRERAMELVGELCRQLDGALKQLRGKRAEGLIAELEEQVALAADIHAQETKRLADFEAEVGADLGELRMLHSAASGQSDLRQEIVQLEADARKFATALRESEQLLGMLRAAEKDPQQLLATPNSLLVSQPALRRLKDGLVDAQLATARLGGTRSADHPRVKAAVESEKEIRADLHRELLTAIRGGEAEVRLAQQRLEATRTRLAEVEGRLDRLAERRAEYSNRVAAVDNTRVTLDRARQKLSTAKAAEAAARSGSLVTRIDQPETGPYPAGLGRTMITAAGGVGGLMLGLGLVFLTTGPPSANSPLMIRAGEAAQENGAAREIRLERNSQPVRTPAQPKREATPLVATRTTPPAPVDELWPSPVEDYPIESMRETSPREGTPHGVVTANQVVTQSPPTKPAKPSEQKAIAPTPNHSAPPKVAESPAVLNPTPSQPTPQPLPVAKPEPLATKPVLPTGAGKLPAAAGTLPSVGAAPVGGGMSLQEALQAARQAQH